MNIGIATFHRAANYGAVLQAHALQTYLRNQGHDARLVDFRPLPEASWARRFISKTPSRCLQKWETEYFKKVFRAFRARHLVCTPEVIGSPGELERLSDRFDLLVAGSDQVWNPRWLRPMSAGPDFFFLAFGGDRPRRISYAASLGHDSMDLLDGEDRRILETGLSRMDAISVRERSGVDLIRALCGRTDAVQVCDPTLLLDRGHYERLAGPADHPGAFLFNFMLHERDPDAERATEAAARSLGIRVRRCNTRFSGLRRGYIMPSPEGWLSHIREAGFVVTNSFHAVVFCLLFQTPFVAVLLDGELGSMNGRIRELLSAVGLEDRILRPGEVPAPATIAGGMDKARVHGALQTIKCNAEDFLSEQLRMASARRGG